MYTYKKLENLNIRLLYTAFLNAFADYSINLNLSFEEFQILLLRRGFNTETSIAAFKESEHKIIGFIINAIRDFNGKRTAYDIITGVTPGNRRKNISNTMFEAVLEIITQNNAQQYLLEVLQNNKAAFEFYKKQGFQISRNFSCFKITKNQYKPKTTLYNIDYPLTIQSSQWPQLESLWDFYPSWQNSTDSVIAIKEQFIYAVVYIYGQIAGYGIIDKQTGDIPQIATHPSFRRKGIAAGIISALVNNTKSEDIRLLNIDDTCTEMKSFLNGLGFEHFASQYEMILPLSKKISQ